MKFAKFYQLLVFVLLFFNSSVNGEQINVYFDLSVPQHEFAANDIRTALEDDSYTVVYQDLSTLASGDRGKKVVIALSDNTSVTSLLTDQGGSAPGALGEQAYALSTTTTPDLSFWVLGGDNKGAMYGGLQVAEYINFDGFSGSYSDTDSPAHKRRGIKFNIPFDAESSTYMRGNSGTAHKHAIRNVWDMSFWTSWFDEMARHRYNLLSLWASHPFTSMVNMEDEYPGIAFQNVEGYDEAGLPKFTKTMSIDEKVKFWQDVMEYGANRGFDIYMITWNIYLYGAEGKYGISDDIGNQNTRDYLEKCVIKFLETYPNIKGIGITAGENLDGSDNENENWLWDTYGEGVMKYAQANPQRELVFIHRIHLSAWNDIYQYFEPMINQSNVKFELSTKYSLAHVHGAIKPDYGFTSLLSILKDNNLKTWINIRNDDFFFLHWGDPAFVRNYINNWDEEIVGFYIGSDGWVFSRVFTAKDPYYMNQKALSIQKTWYMQKLWGRISYNPSVSDELLKKHLAYKYPETNPDILSQAWSKASAAMVLANEQVTDTWRRDATWYPEMWSYSVNGGGHYDLAATKGAEAMPGSDLCDFANTVANDCNGKISAWDNADKIEQLALSAKQLLEGLSYGSNIDLKYNLSDIKSLANLSLYSANKYRAAMHSMAGNLSQARDAMAEAYCYWIQYTIGMDEMYIPVDLQRNQSFSDWHVYDKDVIQDYINLGGDPIIGCGDIAVSGVTLDNCPSQLGIGFSHQLTANISPPYASNQNASWSSSDTTVVLVDTAGNVTAVSEGSATITVATNDGGFTDNCSITAIPSLGCAIPYTDNTIFTLNENNTSTSYGPYDVSCVSGVNISIDVFGSGGLDPKGSGSEDAYTVSVLLNGTEIDSYTDYGLPDGSVATFTELDVSAGSQLEIAISGYVTAGDESYTFGNVIISYSATIMVHVKGVSIDNCPGLNLIEDDTLQLNATISPVNATNQTITWSSSNVARARVDEYGLVTSVAPGLVEISVETDDGAYIDNCVVEVTDSLTSIQKKVNPLNGIMIYPNPAYDRIFIQFSNSEEKRLVKIYNTAGKHVYSSRLKGNSLSIDVKKLNVKGIIFIQIISGKSTNIYKLAVV